MRTFDGILNLLVFVCFEVLIVLIAMSVDFASGFYKARLRGEERDSYGLKRTVSKFILYIGSMCIAAGVDSIFFACGFWGIVHFSALLHIPVVSTIVAVFLCAVEMLSIWEKADRKRRNEAAKTAGLISELISKDTLREAIKEALLKTGDKKTGEEPGGNN
jgi:hypothetical protein